MIDAQSISRCGQGEQFLRIGPHRLANAALLAPMSGVTDAPFRRIVAGYGAGAVVSEMIASEQLVARDAEAVLKSEAAGTGPHIVQLAGCEAFWMAEAARVAEGAGADVVDINMGCPSKRVVNGWAGAALLRDLDHAERLIAAVLGAVRVPVTLKVRLGWSPDAVVAPALARRAAALGVALVTVHGRTRDQFYTGAADWTAVAAVRDAVAVPLVVNGDVDGPDAARRALAASRADAVMIGRAAVGRPWLVGAIGRALAGTHLPEPPLAEQADVAAAHVEASLSHYGTALGLRTVRKHVAGYLQAALGTTPAPALRRTLLAAEEPSALLAGLRAFYRGLEPAKAA